MLTLDEEKDKCGERSTITPFLCRHEPFLMQCHENPLCLQGRFKRLILHNHLVQNFDITKP